MFRTGTLDLTAAQVSSKAWLFVRNSQEDAVTLRPRRRPRKPRQAWRAPLPDCRRHRAAGDHVVLRRLRARRPGGASRGPCAWEGHGPSARRRVRDWSASSHLRSNGPPATRPAVRVRVDARANAPRREHVLHHPRSAGRAIVSIAHALEVRHHLRGEQLATRCYSCYLLPATTHSFLTTTRSLLLTTYY